MREIKKEIKNIVCAILGCKRVSFRKAFKKIDLNSLNFAELIVQTEDKFGVELTGDQITCFHNLREFSIYIGSKVLYDG